MNVSFWWFCENKQDQDGAIVIQRERKREKTDRQTDRQIDRESPEDGITIAVIGNLRPSVFSIISSCYELSRCSIGLSDGVRVYMYNYMSDDSYFLHIYK